MRLSAEDLSLIRKLRQPTVGVLADTKPEALRDKRRFVVIACADGDRFPELFDFHRAHCDDEHCAHTPLRNGGALSLVPSSPLSMRGGIAHHESYLFELKESAEIKDTNEFVMYGHFPCAAAYKFGLGARQVLDYLIEAKDYVRRKVPGAKVSLFIHVDYGEERSKEDQFKTYFFDRAKYLTWKTQQVTTNDALLSA